MISYYIGDVDAILKNKSWMNMKKDIHENITENNIENISEIAYTINRRQIAVLIAKEVIFHARNYES